MSSALLLITAWLLDGIIAEPRRGHPLCQFGNLAEELEQRLNQPHLSPKRRRLLGASALVMLTIPAVLLTAWLSSMAYGWLLELLILFLCLGAHSLREHALAVVRALRQARHDNDLGPARAAVSCLVSRDTNSLGREGVAAATTESVLENGNDALFATLFWFAIAGAPGALLHRLVNTLDAMWGYRDQRFADFGWAAARTDDLLGWLPARLTALTYALLGGRPLTTLRQARRQARHWPGINPGIVLACGALALRIRLGGPTPYPAGERLRPWLGVSSRGADEASIQAAWRLLRHGAWLWLGAILSLAIASLYIY
ncbi:adenosylcobinamide-phosphate synthase [Halorhodospira halochloris]|uniref:Cobalamin biosynthesis protein CobD n=1 Tax=Halorhodospira halochloris TaxID=1052 RepID=A0A110B531_HALHR|nr:adenosylcobinamide-phosphate synthase CbiB [Halorhodospira halochloris]MBK1651384.1 cobalamin biosynthesis protein CobD [Halorhodospira halochloris]BAU57671.1 adenosylcobinamide-phosphate synthase [Halorhodospira halochloris]